MHVFLFLSINVKKLIAIRIRIRFVNKSVTVRRNVIILHGPHRASLKLSPCPSDQNGIGARFANPTAAQMVASILGIKYDNFERQVLDQL